MKNTNTAHCPHKIQSDGWFIKSNLGVVYNGEGLLKMYHKIFFKMLSLTFKTFILVKSMELVSVLALFS